MKEEILKSVAQPMVIFYAPFSLFIMNLVFCVILMVLFLMYGKGTYVLFSVILFVILHVIAILIGKKEPHISSIIAARTNIKVKNTKNAVKEKGNKFTP